MIKRRGDTKNLSETVKLQKKNARATLRSLRGEMAEEIWDRTSEKVC